MTLTIKNHFICNVNALVFSAAVSNCPCWGRKNKYCKLGKDQLFGGEPVGYLKDVEGLNSGPANTNINPSSAKGFRRRLKPGTAGLHVKCPDHSVTPPRVRERFRGS